MLRGRDSEMQAGGRSGHLYTCLSIMLFDGRMEEFLHRLSPGLFREWQVIEGAVFLHEPHESLSVGGLGEFEGNVHHKPSSLSVKRAANCVGREKKLCAPPLTYSVATLPPLLPLLSNALPSVATFLTSLSLVPYREQQSHPLARAGESASF